MCLVALALGAHPRYPLVIAANRDEFHTRAAAPLAWWSPDATAQPILSGRDLDAGGTWMGLTAAGRLALLTNIRAPRTHDPVAPSRGQIVTDWLTGTDDVDRFWNRTVSRRHNGFNLIAADVSAGDWFCASSASLAPQPLLAGIYGLSNAALETAWPKVVALKARLGDALAQDHSVEALALALFDALADRTPAADSLLPETGVALDVERQLSSAFVDASARGYGTRCSTLLITERVGRHDRTHVLERSFDINRAAPSRLRRTLLEAWPPASGTCTATPPRALRPIVEAEFQAAVR